MAHSDMLAPLTPNELTQAERMRERWEEASPTQKLALAAVLSMVLSVLCTYSLMSGPGEWKPLFSNLDVERASQVVEKLNEMGQPYRLGNNGSLILVPPTAVNRLRLELASAGILEQSDKGFELFEQASLSRSDFSEKVTYLRALQGELSATIASIQKVRKARVHLNLAKNSVFLDQSSQSSAAVYVEMSPGAQLNDKQIKGIISLVANSVEGLDAERVTLFDSTGSLQVSGGDLKEGSIGMASSDDRSAELSRLGQSMVDRILGPGKGFASVRVELDFNERRIERESHSPGADGAGVPLRQENTSEQFEGTRPNIAGGTEEQIPVEEVPANGGAQKPKYIQTSTKTDYAVSKTTEVLEEKPGGVARISASVIVDSNAGLTDEQLNDLAEGVKTAIGLQEERGDKFEIRALPFNREHLEAVEEEIVAAEQERAQQKQILLYILAGIGGTVVLSALVGLMLRRRRKRREIWMDVTVDQPDEEPEELDELEGHLDLLLPAEEPEQEPTTDKLLVRALEEVERDPASVARLLERWVEGDGQ